MFATFTKLVQAGSNGDWLLDKEVRIVPSMVSTLEDGPIGIVDNRAPGCIRYTTCKITLKDGRSFVVNGSQVEAAIDLKRVRK